MDSSFEGKIQLQNFIADFFCLECNLVVVVDGDYHNEREQGEYDQGRTFELSELNIKVVRFTNTEVLENIDFVLNTISSHLMPNPSP
jgi:very-short-patch-repair endonuclease